MRRLSLLVLAAFLMVWEPLRLAGEIQSSMGTVGMRGGWAVIELLAHAAVAAFSVASGWALWNGNPAGQDFARYAVVASAGVSIQSVYASALPHQTVPGEQLPFAIVAGLHAAAWVIWLGRLRRAQAV
jgi:hypothetical protein